MKKYYVIIAAALVMLAGCKKEEQKVSEIKDSSREVHFIVSDDVINKATLSTSSGFAWEAGDEDYFGIFTNYPRHAAATGSGDGDGKFAIQPAAGSEITLASGNSFAFSATVRMSTGDTGAYSQIGLYGYNTSSSSWEVIAQCDKRAFNGTPYTYSITGTAAATYSNIQVVAFVRASGANNVVEVKDIIFAKN